MTTLAGHIRHLEAKALVRIGDRVSIACIVVETDQRCSNHNIARRVDNADVGDTRVRGTEVNDHIHRLARRVALDVGLVVGELIALAEPNVALGGVVVGLGAGYLQDALDIAFVVGGLVVVYWILVSIECFDPVVNGDIPC